MCFGGLLLCRALIRHAPSEVNTRVPLLEYRERGKNIWHFSTRKHAIHQTNQIRRKRNISWRNMGSRRILRGVLCVALSEMLLLSAVLCLGPILMWCVQCSDLRRSDKLAQTYLDEPFQHFLSGVGGGGPMGFKRARFQSKGPAPLVAPFSLTFFNHTILINRVPVQAHTSDLIESGKCRPREGKWKKLRDIARAWHSRGLSAVTKMRERPRNNTSATPATHSHGAKKHMPFFSVARFHPAGCPTKYRLADKAPSRFHLLSGR